MEYYIVFNEWHYPNEDGRDFVGDFDSSMDAEFAAMSECRSEADDFYEYVEKKAVVTPITDADYNCTGYQLSSCGYFFRSIIIKREI